MLSGLEAWGRVRGAQGSCRDSGTDVVCRQEGRAWPSASKSGFVDGSLVPRLPFLLTTTVLVLKGSVPTGLCRKVPSQAPELSSQPSAGRAQLTQASLYFPKEEPDIREVKALTKIIQQKTMRGKLNR